MNLYNGADHPIKFREDRTKKQFVSFVKKFIRAEVRQLWSGNLRDEIQSGDVERDNLPWVVFYDVTMSHNELLRLAIDMDGLGRGLFNFLVFQSSNEIKII